jgi:hypothetical protein
MQSLPEATSETCIAERFAPSRNASANAPEVKKPILKPFTATLPWHSQRGKGTMLSLSEAAKTAGLSKSTIWRACKAGRVSFKRTDTGEFQIDAAELHRVFPFHATGANGKVNHPATSVTQTETAILDARITALKDMAELMREQLEDVRKDRDAWRAQVEANQRLVADARTRRGLFGWGAKR